MPHECTTCGRTFDDGSKQMLSGCPDCGGNKFQFQPAGRSGGDSATEPEPDEPQAGETRKRSESSNPSETPNTLDPSETPNTPDSSDTPQASTADTERETQSDISPDETESATVDTALDDAEIADEVGAENPAQSDARSTPATPDEIDEARRTSETTGEPSLGGDNKQSSSSSHGHGTPQGPPTDTPPAEKTDEFDLSGAVGPDDGQPIAKEPSGSVEEPEPEPRAAEEDPDLSALRDELNDQFESIKITAPGQYELNLMELYERKEYIISLQEDGRYVIEMAEDYGVDD